LVWSDEFDDSTLNTKKWAFDLGAGGWGNNELQTYTSNPANVSVRGAPSKAIEARGNIRRPG
jgi:hypothetical protein